MKQILTFAVILFSLPALADDCDGIRSALEKMPATGGTIEIPAGVFTCRSMIVIKKNHVTLRGAGADKTVLRLADQSPSPLLVIGDDRLAPNETGEWVPATRVTDVSVSDLTVDGNRFNQDPSQECGAHACDGDVASIRNNGITIRGASFIRLQNIVSRSNISGGLVTEKHCDHLTVSGFSSYDNYFDGFAGYQTEYSVFENLDLSRNRAAGISLDLDFSRNEFRNAKLENNGDVGIFARDIRGVLFEDLVISNSGNHGVFMSASEGGLNTCASNNEFRSVAISKSRGFGFYLADLCPGNRLTEQTRFAQNRDGCYFAPDGSGFSVDPTVRCVSARATGLASGSTK